MNNLKLHNMCKTELIIGAQIEKNQSEYTLGYKLDAASNIGDKPNQEDSVIILKHPKNENIKLLAVADGVGGTDKSEKASSYLLQEITMYFDMMPKLYFKDTEFIEKYFNNVIKKTNKKIIEQKYGQTTLSMAIILEKETIIFNIGDSRVYTYNKGQLIQETTDDSYVQKLYEIGEIPTKDMMRFHCKSNIITNSVGNNEMQINTKIIPNKYNLLLATTDGVTDFLSDRDIKDIINRNENKNVSKELVSSAIEVIKICNYGRDYLKFNDVHDNATAATARFK